MAIWLIALLRVAHVLAGAFWLGVMLFNAGFLLPATQAAGPAGGQVMKQLVQVRHLPRYLNAAVLINLITGAILLWWVSGGLSFAWFSTGVGIGWTVGAVLAVIAALLGQFVNKPTAIRFGQLVAAVQASGGPPSETDKAQMMQLQGRLLNATRLAALLLVLAASAMAAARYL